MTKVLKQYAADTLLESGGILIEDLLIEGVSREQPPVYITNTTHRCIVGIPPLLPDFYPAMEYGIEGTYPTFSFYSPLLYDYIGSHEHGHYTTLYGEKANPVEFWQWFLDAGNPDITESYRTGWHLWGGSFGMNYLGGEGPIVALYMLIGLMCDGYNWKCRVWFRSPQGIPSAYGSCPCLTVSEEGLFTGQIRVVGVKESNHPCPDCPSTWSGIIHFNGG